MLWKVYRNFDDLNRDLNRPLVGYRFLYAGRFYLWERGTLKPQDTLFALKLALEKRPAEVLSFSYPPEKLKDYFTVTTVKPSSPLTEEEKSLSIPEHLLLSKKYGVKVVKPSLTLKDLKGARVLKEQVEEIKKSLSDSLLRPKGVFLIGVPGTGKSYSCFCTAGELNRIVVELNISRILESEKPVTALERFLELLEILPPSIVWIDEIDKVFRESDPESEKIKGRLLTEIEDFNTERGYKADALFWVTANDVRPIVERNPEFFRRFDYLFFLQPPKEDEAKEIISYYFNQYSLVADEELLTLYDTTENAVVRKALEFWERDFATVSSNEEGRFVYTPAEIKGLALKLARRLKRLNRERFSESDLVEVMRKHYPAVIAYEESVSGMREQIKYFSEV